MSRTYTVREVAQLLGYSTNSIYTFLKEKRIKGVRLGKGRFRIPQAEVDRLLGAKPKQPSELSRELQPSISAPVRVTAEPVTVFDELVPVGKAVAVPSLFDWFVGLASVVLGVSVFFYRNGLEEFAMPQFSLWLAPLAVTFVAGGFGMLLADVTGHMASSWQKTFALLLTLAFAVLTVFSFVSADVPAVIIYGLFTIALALRLTTSADSIGIFGFYELMLLLFLPVALMITPGNSVRAIMPDRVLAYATAIGAGWLGVLLTISIVIWWSYRTGRKFLYWTGMAASGCMLAAVAYVFADNLLWGRSMVLLLSALTGMFVPTWDSLHFTHRHDRKLAFTSFGFILAVFVLAVTAMHLMQDSLVRFTRSGLESKVQYAKAYADTTLTNIEMSLATTADSTPLRDALTGGKKGKADLTFVARTMFESNPRLYQVLILDPVAKPMAVYPLNAQTAITDYAYREYFLQPVATGKPYIARSVQLTGADGGLIAVSVPVKNDKNDIAAVLVGFVSIQDVGTSLEKLSQSLTGEFVVISDTDYRILYHADRNLIGLAVPQTSRSAYHNAVSGVGEDRSVTGQRVLLAYDRLDQVPLTVAIAVPLRGVFELSHSAGILIFSLIAISFFIYIGFLAGQRRVRPQVPKGDGA